MENAKTNILGSHVSNSELDSSLLAEKIASNLGIGDVIALYGDIGAGKSYLARNIIQYFCGNDTIVISPTFNLLQIYEAKAVDNNSTLNSYHFEIYHYDLYRLNHPEEIYELAFEDALSGICIIEWPQIIKHLLPEHTIKIQIEHMGESKRDINITL